MSAYLGIVRLLGTPGWREAVEMTSDSYRVRSLSDDDAPHLEEAFANHGWHKSLDLFIRYADEQRRGVRLCFLAESAESLAGYCTLLWESKYEPFRTAGIPEINDLNVLPPHRGQGVGNALLDVIETRARERSQTVGLGVGLYADYGAAQRIYARRGYVPDGRGVMYRNRPIPPGSTVRLDDDAALMLTLTFP